MSWKSCCCQKNCAYPFYIFDGFANRNFFWAALVSTKIVYGFEALYRPAPTRRRWRTKTVFYEAIGGPHTDQLYARKHFSITFDQLNGRLTLNVIENTNPWVEVLYPSLPTGAAAPATIVQPNSMGFISFNEGDYIRDGGARHVTFSANETHADCLIENGPYQEHWTIDLSDEYDDDAILVDFQTLNQTLAFTPADYGVAGIGLDGIPIGNFNTSQAFLTTAAYNDCPVNGTILFPPLFTPAILTGGLDAATSWPAAAIVKGFAPNPPVAFPFSEYNYQANDPNNDTLATLTWDRPMESWGGQMPGSQYPTLTSCWMKFQIDASCGDFCAQLVTFQGPPGGPAPTLPNPDPECSVAEKIPWLKPAGWPADFKKEPFRRSHAAAPVYPSVLIGNPTHTYELKPTCYFPPYDQDPYHVFCEHFLISADSQQILDNTGIPCDCIDTNPLP